MPYVLFSPHHFDVTKEVVGENVYVDGKTVVDKERARKQHRELCRVLSTPVSLVDTKLPDQVFVANAGLTLPRLPRKVVVLSHLKYAVRKPEVPFFQRWLEARGVQCVQFPKSHVFEGQGECKWFHNGRLLVVGYGFRCTKESVGVLRNLIEDVYSDFGVEPPVVVGLELSSPLFYHMDLAMAERSASSCVAHKGAFVDPAALERLVRVTWWATRDWFMLNCVVTPYRVVVHRLMSEKDRDFMKTCFSPRRIVEVDVSEFEKSGGAVKCLVFQL
jgi:N-dimethylarginine dimethylaminohydrolase